MALHSPADDLTAVSLCTGAGALDLALELAVPALRPVLYVERDAFAAATLVQALEAGYLAPAPLWSNTRTLRGRRFRGCVDLVFGGIPCQPHSEAGAALGHLDPRDLWPATRRIIVQCRAWAVFIENVGGMLHTGGARRVHRDLRRLGYQVEGGLFTAAEVGAPHERERLFVLAIHDALADASGQGRAQRLRQRDDPPAQFEALERGGGPMADAYGRGHHRGPEDPFGGAERGAVDKGSGYPFAFPPGPADIAGWRTTLAAWPHLEPVVRRGPYELAAGMERVSNWSRHARAQRLHRLHLLGNGVVPLEAAYAFRALAATLARSSPGAARLFRMTEAISEAGDQVDSLGDIRVLPDAFVCDGVCDCSF